MSVKALLEEASSLNTLLLPVANTTLSPLASKDSNKDSTPSLVPSAELFEDTAVYPLREPIRPYWSIIQLLAVAAKDWSRDSG